MESGVMVLYLYSYGKRTSFEETLRGTLHLDLGPRSFTVCYEMTYLN